MHIHGQQISGRSQVFRQDDDYSGLVVLDSMHHMIHSGKAFVYPNYDADVDIAGPKYFRLITGANKEVHFDFSCTLLTAGTVSLIEAPTTSGNGSDVSAAIKNLNRRSSITPELAIWEDPTVTVETGVVGLWRIGTAGGFANSSVGGLGSNRQEYILKASTVYAFKILTDADNNRSWLEFRWYEL
jgi:hypothetical protein